jgi:UPF0755 protein
MKKISLIILFFLLIVFAATYFNYTSALKPVSSDTKLKVITINDGDGVESIATNLYNHQLIKNRYSFMIYTYLSGLKSQLKSGNYKFSPSMSTRVIAQKLAQGGTHDYWLKIIDGQRVEEIAALFPTNLSFTGKDFINQTKNLEGYIYPDSYLIPEYFNISQILKTIDDNFQSKITQAKKDKTTALTDTDTIILASLLEREGRTLESKQKIAGVLINRLKIGMALQLDATVQYARDSKTANTKDYWQPVTSAQIDSIISPFNTYKNRGLPPKPICNPGFNSLYAAYHPVSSDYLFYISDSNGVIHFAKTLQEHNQNIQKYLR